MPAAQCESGEKLVLAAGFRERVDIALANYLDRGSDLLYIQAFRESAIDELGIRDSFMGTPDQSPSDEQSAFRIRAHINELGQPQAYYINHEKEYDWMDPMGRYTKSILPTIMTPNGKNIIAQFCTNELTHHDFDQEELTNSGIGYFGGNGSRFYYRAR